MARPDDSEYYVEDRTEHVAQGDIFSGLPFPMALPEIPEGENPPSEGTRPVLIDPIYMEGYGILLSYTSSFMAQPPGTRGYAHPFRLVAPVVPLDFLLSRIELREDQVGLLRARDSLGPYVYLPSYPGEFEESVALLYRPSLLHQDLLEGRRVTQLQLPAARQLQVKIVRGYLGMEANPEQLNPDLTDHWEAQH